MDQPPEDVPQACWREVDGVGMVGGHLGPRLSGGVVGQKPQKVTPARHLKPQKVVNEEY